MSKSSCWVLKEVRHIFMKVNLETGLCWWNSYNMFFGCLWLQSCHVACWGCWKVHLTGHVQMLLLEYVGPRTELKEHWNLSCILKVVVCVYSVCNRVCLSSCVGFLKLLCFFNKSCSLWICRGGWVEVFVDGVFTCMVYDLCMQRGVNVKLSWEGSGLFFFLWWSQSMLSMERT